MSEVGRYERAEVGQCVSDVIVRYGSLDADNVTCLHCNCFFYLNVSCICHDMAGLNQ